MYYDKSCEYSTQQVREAFFLYWKGAQEAKKTMIRSDVELLGLEFQHHQLQQERDALRVTNCGNAN